MDNHLRIVESDQPTIDDIPYAAISYVWKGKAPTCDPGCHLETFHVVGAMDPDTDPIGIGLLRTAAVAEYLWLDRLCIMQADRDDKTWQIKNMGDIYRTCKTCLIFPGGLQRLVGIEEETDWIHRAWTLQEAVVPPSAECVFRFERVIINVAAVAGNPTVYTIEKGRSGRMPIHFMLTAAAMGNVDHQYEGEAAIGTYPVNIFGKNPTANKLLTALMGIFHCRNDGDERENYIWRSALLRTSKREVDMVFSIMGLFGVVLDPSEYRTREDATIGLAQAILAKGGRANWILASDSNTLPIPKFPNACTVGRAGHRTADGQFVEVHHAFGGDFDVVLGGAPVGIFDDRVLRMVLPIARVRVVTRGGLESVEFLDSAGKASGTETAFSGAPGTHAVIVGEQKVKYFLTASTRPTDTVVVLVERCSRDPSLWHRTGITDIERSVLEYCFMEAEVRFALCCLDRSK